ncbi:L,D-transpeptidase family protein [Alkalimarinus sediminis]|uniref:L,D-transpeptidase family protein n=1 Tax=Alkalimarinus sediminis TaxID=1632866 RepID=A0A9E8HPY3_9ALTE|nr:L,D-transpeptidase family protein [Alkalimarinus sediminis]UZW73664.1 L,D-transpeptidase family protein [Alkalimarinus sediminis]
MNHPRFTFGLALALLTSASLCHGKEFPWSQQSDIIGEHQVITAKYEDTLSDVGESNNIGFNEIVTANPGIDAWLPGEGKQIVVPSEYILPSVREGIVINLREYRLYYFPKDGGKVITYPVGIGAQETPSPLIETQVKLKIEQPTWYPPASVRAEYLKEHGKEMQRVFPPGPNNPLGPYAIQLDIPGYFLHGTNKPFGIGTKVSHGCIRLYNKDISELVYKVPKKTPVRFIKEPIKVGMKGDQLYVELHPDEADNISNKKMVQQVIQKTIRLEKQHGTVIDLDIVAIEHAINNPIGIPQKIGIRADKKLAKSGFDQIKSNKKADVVAVSPLPISDTIN